MQDRSRFCDSLLSAIRGLLKAVPNKVLRDGIDLAETLVRDQVRPYGMARPCLPPAYHHDHCTESLGMRDSGSMYAIVPIVEIVFQVCHRCILRIFKHTHYDDYVVEPPSAAELLHQLRHAVCASAPAGSAHEDPNLGIHATPDANEQSPDVKRWPDVCSVCVGVLQHLTGVAELLSRAAERPYNHTQDLMHCPAVDEAWCHRCGLNTNKIYNRSTNDRKSRQNVFQPLPRLDDHVHVPIKRKCPTFDGMWCRILLDSGAGDLQPVPTEPVAEHLSSVAVSGVSADMLAGVLRMVTLPHFHTIDVSVDVPVAVALRERMLAEHLAPRSGVCLPSS
eukprot:354654-Chlamydomonas_euryale.AAC.6